MKTIIAIALIVVGLFAVGAARAGSAPELAPGSAQVITAEALVKILQSSTSEKPLILNVGPSLLYQQAHIPGSEYVGAGSDAASLTQLRARVKSQPHEKFIVLYCGCCPWSHCPNVRPAYSELQMLGFNNVKVLYIANNLGTDWVDKGYPTVKGH
jgi:thiosulfate/3-mercaptopyruvate sulfurtransferase